MFKCKVTQISFNLNYAHTIMCYINAYRIFAQIDDIELL